MTYINPRVRVVLLVCAGISVVVGAIASPFALAHLGGAASLDWTRLGNIGQAYGAASTVFSDLALAGVAVSLAYQARAVAQQRGQAVREQQRDIIDIVCADPETYAPAFSSEAAGVPATVLRRRLFTVRYLHYLAFGYSTGLILESQLRAESLPGLFGTAHGRGFWANGRKDWLEGNADDRRFARIVDDEYRKALAAGPPVTALDPLGEPDSAGGRRLRRVREVGLVAAAVTVIVWGIGLASGARRRRGIDGWWQPPLPPVPPA